MRQQFRLRTRQAGLILLCAALLLTSVVLVAPGTAQAQGGWQGFYWNNTNFDGPPNANRTDTTINFNWGSNSPIAGINADNFSVRWYNTVAFAAGTYRFRAGGDDGIRVAINGQKIIDKFTSTGSYQEGTAEVVLGAGSYQIIVDFFETTGLAGALFDWTVVSGGGVTPTVPGVTVTLTPFATATKIPQVKAVVIVDTANVRSGPGMTYPTIAQILRDQVYKPIGRNGDFGFETWYLLDLGDGRKGWASRSVIYLYNGDPASLPRTKEVIDAPALPEAPPGSVAVQPFEVQGVARNNALVRSAPSLRVGEKIGVIPKGSTFRILRLSRNGAWLFVDYSGLQGWTYTPNVRVTLGSLSALPRGD